MTENVIRDIARRAAAHIDEHRLWRRHMEMSEIGAIPNNGVNRQALSKSDIAARQTLIDWARARDFKISQDEIGNLFIRRHGDGSNAVPVMTGSHMDSQPCGGRFDGIYGVLAGLEAIEALEDANIETMRPIDVVAWTNEEGSRFDPGGMGSMVFTGIAKVDDFAHIQDADGKYFAHALEETLKATPVDSERPTQHPITAYLEAHIEQGPVLENTGNTIGAVTGIQGSRRFQINISGESAHAGTAPLKSRRDALQSALRCLTALNEVMDDPDDILRYTVGKLLITPNSPNAVASRAEFSIDLRHPDEMVLENLSGEIGDTCTRAAPPCEIEVLQTFRKTPEDFNSEIVSSVESASKALGFPTMKLPSGAFHDAGVMAPYCPSAMIFVPCAGGISHNEAEFATASDLAAGAKVLAACLVELGAK
ncbi:MAG: Zn-dependent hydrolase [Rhodospirillaceae bacterium]|nr:Zn-dependent hydrolase [Rhodospirillaceae bacterium]|tara:strand:- start:26798 stop:28066 length:1269 start_codon:yes stop_codon:yes gene_type:complete